ncbi:Nitroreductase [Desulfocicer vacuolatum DSM 3385]|uniref:Nitroreductase n=1 Tax=Desulfocicer vacuolatum DSM 3385 TaxID=1121400 RepID=A0A1W2A216_9BACT|nr:nitroreductase family protein [Desulfocicer vacuolatum]SMC54471.1 Nitroreductase [Desulfocicer vacuolatum DSM 3385]
MTVAEAMQKRRSVRAFLNKPIPEETLRNIFEQARKTPSNCNVQPWQTYVVSGEKRDQLRDLLLEEVNTKVSPEPDFNWQIKYEGIHRSRQFGSAFALYDSMGIERENKDARAVAMLRNWSFFDAPHVAFFVMEKYLGLMGAVDLGIYAQSLALLMVENGISSCIQAALGQFPGPIRKFLNLPGSQGILFGMSFGYEDLDADVNRTRTDRVALNESVQFIG